MDRLHFEKKKSFGTPNRGGNNNRGNNNKSPQQSGAAITIGSTNRKKQTQHNTPQIDKEEKTYKVSDSLKKKETITIGDAITVKEFSEKM